MKIPEKIPIMRMEDYPTHYLGITDDKRQFWAYETFVFEKPIGEILNEDWMKYRREYLVLHVFDLDGNHLQTDFKYLGTTEDLEDHNSDEAIEAMIAKLGDLKYNDINIKIFQTEIDGYTFGLIPNEENESIELQPSSLISFQAPWDGEYYT